MNQQDSDGIAEMGVYLLLNWYVKKKINIKEVAPGTKIGIK